MDKTIFEMNNLNNIRRESDMIFKKKLNEKSKALEIFSAMVSGESLDRFGNEANVVTTGIKNLAESALYGDVRAKMELNQFQKQLVAPQLTKMVNLFSFMGKFKDIPYDAQPIIETYKHEAIRSNFQAAHGDVNFPTVRKEEYPISTQTISAGYAVDYREIASGNLDRVSEGMEQVKIDMMNKATAYVVMTMYDRIKNATGVKCFAETEGIVKSAVDDAIANYRKYGTGTSLLGDYSVVSQINAIAGQDFMGNKTSNLLPESVMEEIRKKGVLSYYNSCSVVELPNQYNFSQLTPDGKNFATYMPEGLLYIIPQGMASPLQIFRRGGLTSLTGTDITTGTEITRFDMEIGADVARGQEHRIGIIRDKNFDKTLLGK